MKTNGEPHCIWRAVDHESEVLESFVIKRWDHKTTLKFLRKTRGDCNRQIAVLRRSDEDHRQYWQAGNRPLVE